VAQGDEVARFAIRVFCRSVTRAIAGFVGLHGVKAVVFTGGIGENDAATREEVAESLHGMGMEIDVEANRTQAAGLRRISAAGAKIAAWVAPAEEDLMIARHVKTMLMR
jgi:acetate kinase